MPHSSPPWSNEGTRDAFGLGDLVVLLKDNPPACPELRAGQAGRIVCCGDPGRPGEFLVSWISGNVDIGTGARGATESVIFPSGSAVWMDPNEVPLGRPFDQCGTLRESPEGCTLLETETGRVYNLLSADELSQTLDAATEIQYGDRVRIRGLINKTGPGPDEVRICPQADGDVYHPIITLGATAEEADCCTATIGDRIIQLHADREASNSLFGHTMVTLQLDFRGRLAVDVTPAITAGGTWQGFAVPKLAGPGTASVRILVQAEGVNLSELSSASDMPVAEVSLAVLPAE
jgi:hypothetical protein